MNKITVSNGLEVLDIRNPAFARYGRMIDKDFSRLVTWMEKNSESPKNSVVYFPSVAGLEEISDYQEFLGNHYGCLPYQIGYCNGMNSALDALEYHKGNEINVAVTDLVVLLGCQDDIVNNTFDTKKVKAFRARKGDAFEFYGTCLHFAPCMVDAGGFKAIVVLPKGTNVELAKKPNILQEEDKLLFAANKWLIAHPEAKDLVTAGAFVGLTGENLQVK